MACSNCGREGHNAASCPYSRSEKKCSLCGETGHTRSNCPNSITCSICKRKGHNARSCPQKSTTLIDRIINWRDGN